MARAGLPRLVIPALCKLCRRLPTSSLRPLRLRRRPAPLPSTAALGVASVAVTAWPCSPGLTSTQLRPDETPHPPRRAGAPGRTRPRPGAPPLLSENPQRPGFPSAARLTLTLAPGPPPPATRPRAAFTPSCGAVSPGRRLGPRPPCRPRSLAAAKCARPSPWRCCCSEAVQAGELQQLRRVRAVEVRWWARPPGPGGGGGAGAEGRAAGSQRRKFA
jgi:hypothetical protein